MAKNKRKRGKRSKHKNARPAQPKASNVIEDEGLKKERPLTLWSLIFQSKRNFFIFLGIISLIFLYFWTTYSFRMAYEAFGMGIAVSMMIGIPAIGAMTLLNYLTRRLHGKDILPVSQGRAKIEILLDIMMCVSVYSIFANLFHNPVEAIGVGATALYYRSAAFSTLFFAWALGKYPYRKYQETGDKIHLAALLPSGLAMIIIALASLLVIYAMGLLFNEVRKEGRDRKENLNLIHRQAEQYWAGPVYTRPTSYTYGQKDNLFHSKYNCGSNGDITSTNALDLSNASWFEKRKFANYKENMKTNGWLVIIFYETEKKATREYKEALHNKNRPRYYTQNGKKIYYHNYDYILQKGRMLACYEKGQDDNIDDVKRILQIEPKLKSWPYFFN